MELGSQVAAYEESMVMEGPGDGCPARGDFRDRRWILENLPARAREPQAGQ
jgi:hypothetical protein